MARCARHPMGHTKSLCHRLVSFTLLPFFGKQLLLSPIGWLAALTIQWDTPKAVSFTLLPFFGKQLLLSHIAWLAVLAMQCDTPKAYASHHFSSWRFQHSFLQERYYDIWSQAYLRTRAFWNRSLRSLYACFARYPKCVTHLWCVSATANPIPLLVSL